MAVLSSTFSIRNAVKRELGIAFMSEMALAEEECSSGVKAIPITDLVVEKDVYVVYSKNRTNKKLLKHFIETILKFK